MKLKILLAEDNPINQRVTSMVLSKAGHWVDIVEDGAAAIESCKRVDYDVVLMDCQMPILDGVSATYQIRKLAIRQPIIIAVTARVLAGAREECLASGMNEFIGKPFRATTLLDTIELATRHQIRSLSITA